MLMEKFYLKRGKYLGVRFPLEYWNPTMYGGPGDRDLDAQQLAWVRERREEDKRKNGKDEWDADLCWCEDTPENIKKVENDPLFIRWMTGDAWK